jgi:hypothetical protein
MQSLGDFQHDWNTIFQSDIDTFIQAEEYNFTSPTFFKDLKKYNRKNYNFVLGGTQNSVSAKYLDFGEVKYWSDYFAYKLAYYLNVEKYLEILKPQDITIPFTFYVRNSREFREYLHNNLRQKDVLKYGDWSYNDNSLDDQIIYLPVEKQLSSFYNPLGLHLKSYNNSFLDIVCETYNDEQEKYYITEKTWRPILWGKPFLIAGISGINKRMEKMGFKLFDEIIDYSFDAEYDWQKRMTIISEQVVKLCKSNHNFNELYYDVLYPKINHNRALLMNNILKQKDIPEVCLQVPLYSEYIKGAQKNIEKVLDIWS